MERESLRTMQIRLGQTAALGLLAVSMRASTLLEVTGILYSPPQTGKWQSSFPCPRVAGTA